MLYDDRIGKRVKLNSNSDFFSLQLGILFAFSASGSQSSTSKVVLVFFVGGYTLAEVAAFRLLQANVGLQFIVAGTSNISGKSLIKSVLSD